MGYVLLNELRSSDTDSIYDSMYHIRIDFLLDCFEPCHYIALLSHGISIDCTPI